MSEPGVIALPLPDASARRRIQTALDTCLLVEAGAGSGKTWELVNRMVALVASGTTTVDHIAAVTFTRKAAGELRERLQAGLEERLRDRGPAGPSVEERARLRQALEEIDRAFVGTIHAFCSRLLRERPMEVGLDPAFEELPAEDRIRLRRQFWEAYLERLARDAHPALEEIHGRGFIDRLQAALASELLTLKAGLYNNCTRLHPPLTIEDDRLEKGLDILKKAIKKA